MAAAAQQHSQVQEAGGQGLLPVAWDLPAWVMRLQVALTGGNPAKDLELRRSAHLFSSAWAMAMAAAAAMRAPGAATGILLAESR